jgi:ketosteroid isomerase-like protein
MSQENVEIVRRRFDAFNDGDLTAALALTDPNIEWWDRVDDPGAGVYRGQDAVVKHLAEIAEELELQIEPLEFVDAGDAVVVVLRLFGRGVGSGVPFEEHEVHVFKLRDGKVTEQREYRERSEALKALGLEE